MATSEQQNGKRPTLWARVGAFFRGEQLSLSPPTDLPGKPPRRDPPQTLNFQFFDRWSTHPGHGLTPQRVREIFYEAEVGYPLRQCDLFEDLIESDAHLRQAFESRIEAVAGKHWTVLPGGDRKMDQTAARRFEDALRAVPNTRAMFEHQLSDTAFGYAATEIMWGVSDDGYIVPTWFANVPHRRFRFDLEADEPHLLTKDNTAIGELLEPGKWILSRRRHRLTEASGLMRTGAWLALIKRLAFRDWVVWMERYGLPYVTGQYEDGATDEDKAVLKVAIQKIGSEGAAMMSERAKITLTEVGEGGKATDVHGALCEMVNAEISKLVTGATLTSEAKGPGSYALGQVHQDRSFDLVAADAERLEHRIKVDLAVPFLRFNGLSAAPPRLKIHVVRTVDPLTRARVAAIYANDLGGKLSAEQLRTEFQFKPPIDDADTLKGQKPGEKTPPGIAGGGGSES